MPSLLQRLKYAWDTLVRSGHVHRGRHRRSGRHMSYGQPNSYAAFRPASGHTQPYYPVPPPSPDRWKDTLDWHESPLIGRYVRSECGIWWSHTVLENLGYEVSLKAPGPEPTAEQVTHFEALAARLPAVVAASGLEPIPAFDPWQVPAPPFDLCTAHVAQIFMRADRSCTLLFEVDRSGDFELSPLFAIAPDHSLISAEWVV